MNKTYRVGDVTVTKIDEMRLEVAPPSVLYPDWDEGELKPNLHWLTPGNLGSSTGNLIQSVHSWLVRTKHHRILVDTAAGNDKERPQNPIFHHVKSLYLERLAAASVSPEQVDYVLLTHLHVDHCGWNTRLVDGRWVPTFPNARYVFSKAEEDYYSSPASHNDVNMPSRGVYEDSVAPIIEAGLAEPIGNAGGDYLDNFTFRPTKGHSVGHMSIELRSNGEEALFGGDVMHHPFQIVHPDWNSVFCEWRDEARASRRWALEHAAERNMVFFTTHFAESSVGHVSRVGDRFTWAYE